MFLLFHSKTVNVVTEIPGDLMEHELLTQLSNNLSTMNISQANCNQSNIKHVINILIERAHANKIEEIVNGRIKINESMLIYDVNKLVKKLDLSSFDINHIKSFCDDDAAQSLQLIYESILGRQHKTPPTSTTQSTSTGPTSSQSTTQSTSISNQARPRRMAASAKLTIGTKKNKCIRSKQD